MHAQNLYFTAMSRIIKGKIELAGDKVSEDVGTENP